MKEGSEMGAPHALSFPLPAPFSFILFYGMNPQGVSPSPQLGARVQCQQLLATPSWAPCTGQVTQPWVKPSTHPPWCDPSGEAGIDSASWEEQPARIPISSPAASGHHTSPKTCPFPCKPCQSCQGSVLLLPGPNSCGCDRGRDIIFHGKLGMAVGLPSIAAGAAAPGPALQLKGPPARCPHQCDHPQSSCGEILQCLKHLGCAAQHYPHIHQGLAFFNMEP